MAVGIRDRVLPIPRPVAATATAFTLYKAVGQAGRIAVIRWIVPRVRVLIQPTRKPQWIFG